MGDTECFSHKTGTVKHFCRSLQFQLRLLPLTFPIQGSAIGTTMLTLYSQGNLSSPLTLDSIGNNVLDKYFLSKHVYCGFRTPLKIEFTFSEPYVETPNVHVAFINGRMTTPSHNKSHSIIDKHIVRLVKYLVFQHTVQRR